VPSLVLGPLLRHVDSGSATVWVETDRKCAVEVLGVTTPTWCVAGHHYAVVCIDGLAAGSSTPYEVRLDGELVWPDPESPHPPSRIRTVDPDRPLRLVFGSCRAAEPRSWTPTTLFGADALDTYAERMAGLPADQWPDALLLLGDQVYADETSPITQRRIRERRDVSRPPYTQVADFEEYTYLYHESWSDPQLRWLLSTLPTSMIFDDHDVHDDWNTSQAWREDMEATYWWAERITGALMAYWIYQHLGNLAPDALAANEVYQQVRAAADAEPVLREFAKAADREADGEKGAQWSYRRDFGRTRLLMIDSRCGRILAVARARYPDPVPGAVYQLVCSPVHQEVPRSMRFGFRVGWSRPAELLGRLVCRLAGVPPLPLSWDRVAGPFFGNQLATLTIDGRSARLAFECAAPVNEQTARMQPIAGVTLSPPPTAIKELSSLKIDKRR